MKIKWLLIFGLLFVMLLAPVCAQEIVVTSKPVTDTIAFDETARFTLTITNNQDIADKFTFASTPSQLGPATLWRFNPQVVDILSGSSEDVIFDITPPKDINIGTYDIDIVAYSLTNPKIRGTGTIRFYVTKEFPHLSANMGLPGELYPGTVPVNVIVENNGAETQVGLTAVFSSELFGTYDLEIGELKPGETRLIFNQEITVPTTTETGKYPVRIAFYKNGEYVSETKKDINILGKGNMAITQNIDKGILTTDYSIRITNTGNAIIDDEWTTVMPCWKRFLVSATPKALRVDVIPGKTATFVWPVILAPGENTVINYQIAYAPLLAIIIAILFLLYVLAWYFKKEFSITKEAVKKKDHIEVRLTVKNHTSEVQHDIIVEDKIPTPLKLVKEFGTQAPTAIRKEGGSVRVVWKFRHLGPFEERILTYGLRSRLGIVGLIILPETILRLRINKKIRKFFSNTVTITGRISVREKEEEA